MLWLMTAMGRMKSEHQTKGEIIVALQSWLEVQV